MAERLFEPDGPEVVTIGPARSPSYFDQMTMDSARTAAINRLRGVDIHHRFSAFSAHTPNGGPIIVHSKVTIIDDRLLRIGSANLNNRSFGVDLVGTQWVGAGGCGRRKTEELPGRT